MSHFISILIPTKGRIEGLTHLLQSLSQMSERDSIAHEILIINNATDETRAGKVEALVQGYIEREGDRWRHVREPIAGKSRALNTGLTVARGAILGFLDDDVVVAPSWLTVTHNFFAQLPCDVQQGSIHIPPEFAEDKEFLRLLSRYRTIYYLMKPFAEGEKIKSLNAANLAVRRELFDRTGYFDERLGPGASGTSMDSEFGDRVKRLGGRLGYEPRAVVYHQVDWSRLTDKYFRWRNEAEGRSNLLYKDITPFDALSNLLRSAAAFCFYWLAGSEHKKYRMKGRCFRYRAMLRVMLQERRNFQTPIPDLQKQRVITGPCLSNQNLPHGERRLRHRFWPAVKFRAGSDSAATSSARANVDIQSSTPTTFRDEN